MILILSDNSRRAADIGNQLELYGDRYLNYFTDFKVAGTHGRGSAIVGGATQALLSEVLVENKITSLVDCITEPCSEASSAAQKACALKGVHYVKYLNITDKPGLKLKLYYSHIAELIKRSSGNTLLYASPRTVRGIAECAGEADANKMYAPVRKAVTFDTSMALEYSIPLLNIIETEWFGEEEDTAQMLNKVSADMVVCDDTIEIDNIAAAAFKAGVPIILTHSMGMEFCCAAATARDAVISIHTKDRKD